MHNEPHLPSLEEVVSGSATSLFVGPEGGWSESELDLARESGSLVAQLGPYRLRSETAGIVAVAGRWPRWSVPQKDRRGRTMDDNDCIFCKIANKEIEADVILEEDEVLAFHDINGRAPVHALVIPRQHIGSLAEVGELPDAVAKRLFEASQDVAEKLGVAESGYAVRVNNGPDAGQEVFHLHLHVLGGDKIGMP